MESLKENHEEFMQNNKKLLKSQQTFRSEKNNVFSEEVSRRVTKVGQGGGLPYPFSKNRKKCPNFGQKISDCAHLWAKFLI